MEAELETKGRIVVGTDGSPRAEKAVDWAAARAAARGIALLVVFVASELPLPGRTVAAAQIHHGKDYVADYLADAQRKVDAVVETMRARYPGLDATGKVVQGSPSYVLTRASRDADQVVVGARGAHAPLSVRLLGGVSDAVATHAHGPVVVVGDDAHEHPNGPVVVGVDDSPAAKAAIKLAFEAAELRGVPVIAVNSWDFGPYDAYNAEIWDQSIEGVTRSLTELVDELLAEQKAAHPNVPVEIRVVRGRPERALVEASKEAGITVVGSRGRGGFAGLLLGSTSKHVLREARSPVIVTRG
ncbi:MAG: universal stress protein [Brooklawnia sp.]|uniref:universal stress protein n=1 Tax=Brooklawnia sp. TaxID=2699740 RepID=UPI003C70CEDA